MRTRLRACLVLGMLGLALLAPTAHPSAAAAPAPILRDETHVLVDGVDETWRLEWRQPPKPDCTDAPAVVTCPCNGYEYGERGHLDLVRLRSGAPEERMALDTVFEGGEVRLSRWTVDPAERGKIDVATLAGTPPAHVLTLGDYDHDGRPTEFVLPVTYYGCGHTPRAAIGISRAEPHLHAFAPAEEPSDVLYLERASSWETLRTHGDVWETQLACGDHGSGEKRVVNVRARDGRLHVRRVTTPCPAPK